MAPRALGALLALAAAILFVVSVASSAWWAGHPIVEGHERDKQVVSVGLLGAKGCNTGGDGSCASVEVGSMFSIASYVELGLIGLTVILAFMVAAAAWAVGDRRRSISNVTIFFTLLTSGGAGAVFALGPDIAATQHVDVPIGWGLYVFGGALGSLLIASLITRKLEVEPLRLKPSMAHIPQPAGVREMLQQQHDGVRPSQPNMYDAAPQLRPLYDPLGAGHVPTPPTPQVPLRAPTPMPHDAIKAFTGQTPPPAPRGKPGTTPPLTSPPTTVAGITPPPIVTAPRTPSRNHSPSSSPRNHSPSSPPPRTQSPSSPPNPRAKVASASPPVRAESDGVIEPPRPRAKTLPPPMVPEPSGPPARAKPPTAGSAPGGRPGPSVPLPARGKPATAGPAQRPSQPTLAHAIPPMPTVENLPAPAVLPARESPRASTENDDRLETAMRETEHITAVEVDAEAKAAAKATGSRRSLTDARTGQRDAQIGDVTDVGVEIPQAPMIITGEERALSTSQLGVARAATEDPFDARERQVTDASLTTEEHDAQVPKATEQHEAQRGVTEHDEQKPTEQHPAQATNWTEPHEVQVPSDPAPPSSEYTDRDIAPEDLKSTIERKPKQKAPVPEPTPEAAAAQARMSTAPSSLPPPKKQPEPMAMGPTPACPQCESPMAWIEEHLRFYCKQCRMYF